MQTYDLTKELIRPASCFINSKNHLYTYDVAEGCLINLADDTRDIPLSKGLMLDMMLYGKEDVPIYMMYDGNEVITVCTSGAILYTIDLHPFLEEAASSIVKQAMVYDAAGGRSKRFDWPEPEISFQRSTVLSGRITDRTHYAVIFSLEVSADAFTWLSVLYPDIFPDMPEDMDYYSYTRSSVSVDGRYILCLQDGVLTVLRAGIIAGHGSTFDNTGFFVIDHVNDLKPGGTANTGIRQQLWGGFSVVLDEKNNLACFYDPDGNFIIGGLPYESDYSICSRHDEYTMGTTSYHYDYYFIANHPINPPDGSNNTTDKLYFVYQGKYALVTSGKPNSCRRHSNYFRLLENTICSSFILPLNEGYTAHCTLQEYRYTADIHGPDGTLIVEGLPYNLNCFYSICKVGNTYVIAQYMGEGCVVRNQQILGHLSCQGAGWQELYSTVGNIRVAPFQSAALLKKMMKPKRGE